MCSTLPQTEIIISYSFRQALFGLMSANAFNLVHDKINSELVGSDGRCNRIYLFLTAVHYFDDVFVGKQPIAWKKYCTGEKN